MKNAKKMDRVVASNDPYFDPSVNVYRIRGSRLYDSNDDHKVYPCFYFKEPKNKKKARRLQIKNEIQCSSFKRHIRLLMRLRLVR